MRTRYWAPRLLGLLSLLGLGRAGTAQTVPTHDDSLKGQIWTTTARRIWADEKLASPPKQWATAADFTKWALTQQEDKSELGSLWAAVVNRVGKGQTGTPAQVANAILAEVAQRKQQKVGALMKVNPEALRTDLKNFTTPPSATPTTLTAPDSAVRTASPTTGGSPTTVPEDKQPAPELRAVPVAPAAAPLAGPPHYFGLPPWLAGLGLALLGALAGAWLANARAHRARVERHRRLAQATFENTNKLHEMTPEESILRQENLKLTSRVQHLEREVAELRAQLPATPASPPPLATEEDALFDVALAEPVSPVAAPALPVSPATRYGPVQETPFVEERKIVDAPLPQLALMLTVNPKNPDQATFTLNPQVDQARLIGDGLTRLQKFFDYDLPAAGRITSVAAGAKGMLQRHADGWQVVERARLLIS